MAIPHKISSVITAGIVGEFAFDGPRRVATTIITSNTEKNIIGSFCTYGADGETVIVGGTGAFAGILMSPKTYAVSYDITQDVIPQGSPVEIAMMGEIYIELTNEGKNGDVVVADADGVLTSKTVADPADVIVGKVSRHNASTEAPHLAILRMTE